ncbi:hypothetical protein ACFGT5_001499 [Serratia marcescens]|nr:hypothetical protein [Serratia marcescens]
MPKPPTAAVYEAVNNGTLEFRPI